MNPDKPSRDEIEAKLTALLLGELPEEEARLLRYTISQDPALAKLHDRLKATIGLVRHVSANPTETAPLKLSADRRQKLLAHFKTPRPVEEAPLVKPLKLSRFIEVLVAVAILAVLAAMLLPVLAPAKRKAMSIGHAQVTRQRELEAQMAEQDRAAAEAKKPEQTKSIVVSPAPAVAPPPATVPPAPRQQIYLPIAFAKNEGEAQTQTTVSGLPSQTISGYVNQPLQATDYLSAQPTPGASTIAASTSETPPPPSVNGIETGPQSQPSMVTALPAMESIQPMTGMPMERQAIRNPGYGDNLGSAEPASQHIVIIADGIPAPTSPTPVQTGQQVFLGDLGGTTFSARTDNFAINQSSSAPKFDRATGFGGFGGFGGSSPGSGAGGGGGDGVIGAVAGDGHNLGQQSNQSFYRFSANTGTSSSGSAYAVTAENSRGRSQANPMGQFPEAALEKSAVEMPSGGRPVEYKLGSSAIVVTTDKAAVPPGEFPVAPSGYVETKDGRKVPIVGDVPVVGSLFSNNANSIPAQPASGTTLASRNINGVSGTAYSGQLNVAKSTDFKETKTDIAYNDDKQKLEQLESVHSLLYSKITAQSVDANIPRSTMVVITDVAQPGKSGGLWDRLTGKVESTARIKVENEGTIIQGLETPSQANFGYDAYFIQTTEQIIGSQDVLGKAVEKLDLQQKWANGGEKLTKDEAIARLKGQISLSPIKDTQLLAITATSKDPKESADIANAVAEAYRDYRTETSKEMMTAGLAALEKNYAEEDKQIQVLQANVNRPLGQLGIIITIQILFRLISRNQPVSPERMHWDLVKKQALDDETLRLKELNSLKPLLESKIKAESTEQEDLPLSKPAPNAPIPQPEILTTANAFSTFAMNVSDVSYKLAAASLQKGVMPEAASIRSEEFINAFDYRDPEAAPGEPIAFTSERAQNPFEQDRDFLRFSIKTAAAGRQSGRPLNLVLLLDNSGSMERADRVAIIREALRVLATQLSVHDTVSIVTFSRTARLWVDGVPGDKAQAAFDEVSGLTPQGGTNLEEAMRLAYETARRHYLANGMNRVVLLTDGAANLGTVDAKVLTQKVEENRQQGIALDCFGIGWEDYNDDLLEQLTSHSDGRYAFLNSPADASTDFAAKLAGALQIAAEEVKVQVEFNPDRVIAHRQIGYATHQLTKEQFRDNSVAAGEIAAQEAGNALYTVELKPDGSGPIATVHLRYRVPGTTDYRERSWNVDYTGRAVALDKSSPAMRLAVTSAEFAESLATSPYAQQVSLDSLLNDLRGVPESYGADPRPKQLEWMIRQAKSVSGK